jgi:3-deoxy-D-manno-octulosonate 8-phosphate phosphatase KdsC-like HAD superfamily phosphatase
MPAKISAAIRQRAARIKLFLCDVDGVLTDGSILIRLTTSHSRAD